MKRLYLVRHAKSSWKDQSLQDFDRPLNKRGKADAPLMGKRLAKRRAKPDLIVASPARRAVSTVKHLADALDYPRKKVLTDERLYLAGTEVMLQVLGSTDEKVNELLIVGHNPGLTELAERISGESIGNIPTAGAIAVDFPFESWKDIHEVRGKLAFFDYPKLPWSKGKPGGR